MTLLLILTALAVVVICQMRSERRKRAAFVLRFPAISDEEFLARCAPGTNPDIALKVRRIVSNSLGVDYDRIHPDARFVEDLGAD